ncbi:MAG: permease of the drug/metabolite transporter superfamily [Caulobacteraceae bacterium]|jgi:drug/metabolite transporter (DMT)-like permease|nr:permease of the drug/metabolite transporter superfamily [Caulobacteraceae bacterium]
MVDPPLAVAAPRRVALSPNVRGALWMLLSAVTFTAMTTLIKFLGKDYPASLQAFYRQAAGLLVLAPWILRHPVRAFATTRPGILIFRAGAGTIGMIMSFYAFQKMPLAEANALSFTRALWLVPLAAFVLREKVGPHRIGAAIVGFLGVVLMLHPDGKGGAIGVPQLCMLAASLLFSFTVVGMKALTRDHPPSTLLYWSAALGFLFTLPLALLSWRWPTPGDLALLCLMGAIATVNQACYIKGMQAADAAAMAPIDYTRLVFSATAGFFLFGEVPGGLTLLGAAVVIASTLYITWREHMIVMRMRTEEVA